MANLQTVYVTFEYQSVDPLVLLSLEEKLGAAIAQADVGQYGGCDLDMAGFEGTFVMQGPDARALLKAVMPVLNAAPFITQTGVMFPDDVSTGSSGEFELPLSP